jgi:hypothetical protein
MSLSYHDDLVLTVRKDSSQIANEAIIYNA